MEKFKKWENDYINNVDLEKIKFIKITKNELGEFIQNNYFDTEYMQYVHSKKENSIPSLFGLTYLNFKSSEMKNDYSFILGITDNNINKKTIICAVVYLDEYYMFQNQKEPFTYISTIEVNSFFRKMGIYKKVCNMLVNFINPNQHVLTSEESLMGKECNTFEILKQSLINNGFQKLIVENNYDFFESELYNTVFNNGKSLKKYRK